MGNYLFNNEVLIASLNADAENPASTHDFARDILPGLIQSSKIFAYDFRKNRVPIPSKGEEPSYWRDLGTIDAYYEASMDLCSIDPSFNLYNRSWPLRTVGYADPPAKFVFDWKDRQGMAVNSIVAEGTIISGSYVHNCVVGRNVRIHSYSQIEDSVIMDWVEIGRGCKIRHAIIDKANVIPSGTRDRLRCRRGSRALLCFAKRRCRIGRGPAQNYLGHDQSLTASLAHAVGPSLTSCHDQASSHGTLHLHSRPFLPTAAGKPLARSRRAARFSRTLSRLERKHHRGMLCAQLGFADSRWTSRISSWSITTPKSVSTLVRRSFLAGSQSAGRLCRDPGRRPGKPEKLFRPWLRSGAGLQSRDHAAGQQPRPRHSNSLGHRATSKKDLSARRKECGSRKPPSIWKLWNCSPSLACVLRFWRRIRRRAFAGIGEAQWHELNGGPSTAHAPTSTVLPSGRSSRYFFMTARSRAPWLSKDCFRTAIVSSNRLTGAFAETRRPQLVHIATDGESYGHHHRFGDMALAYALNESSANAAGATDQLRRVLGKTPADPRSRNRREKLLELRPRHRSLVERLRLQLGRPSRLEPGMAHAAAQCSGLAARHHRAALGRESAARYSKIPGPPAMTTSTSSTIARRKTFEAFFALTRRGA